MSAERFPPSSNAISPKLKPGNPDLHTDLAAGEHEEEISVRALADDHVALLELQRLDDALDHVAFLGREALEQI